MNATQTLIAIAYGALVLLCCVGLAFLLRSTSARRRAEVDHDELAGMEVRWGGLVAVLLLVLLAITITQVPYGASAEDEGPGVQTVRVTGLQFGWAIKPATVRAGRPVEFRLHSRDVQHGFGLYRGTELVFQVQVPAKDSGEQVYIHTFDEPGSYDVSCLEFCGYQHHAMRGTLKVEG